VLKTNIRRILTTSNFGNYHRSPALKTVDKINFTTLIAQMISYSDYPFNYEETVRILDRLITEYKTIEAGGEKAYKPKLKNRDFTDPDDQPDVYDFNRKYPRVHPNEEAFFEKMYEQEVTRDMEADRLKESIWNIEMEKQKIIEEELLREAREKEEAVARKAKEEKERLAKIAQKKKEEQEARDKAKLEELERQRQRNEKIEADRLARERQEQERKERLKIEAANKLAAYNKGLNTKLRESQNRLNKIAKNEPNTHTNSKMFNEKPDLFKAVDNNKAAIPHRNVNIFAPKVMNLQDMKKELAGKNIPVNFKDMKIADIWPDKKAANPQGAPQVQKKTVQIFAEDDKGGAKVRFELNQQKIVWGATNQEVPEEDFKTMVPRKPGIGLAGQKPVVGQKRVYQELNGKAYWQRYNERGVWEDTNQPYRGEIRLV